MSLLQRTLVAAFLGALTAGTAAAEWRSVGALPPPSPIEDGLVFASTDARLAVTALSPEVVRVRFAPAPAFGRDHSYAVVGRPPEKADARVEVGRGSSTIATAALRVTVAHDPLRVSVADASGTVLDEDDPGEGISWSGSRLRAAKRLREDDHVYGFGEKNGRLDKRGWALGGYRYVMWNSDTYAYDASTDPLYVSVPFYMVLRGGRAYGIFLDNTFRSFFDVGHTSPGVLSFGAEGGELDYYFIYGPTPRQVVERYTELTGRIPLPPRWALGYNQCRWSYYPESRVRLLADTFRERRIPADVIWLDIHYLDGYNPLTWDKARFPDPTKMIADLAAQGFRVVTIVDPHPKKEPGWAPYDSGLAGGHFVKNPDGSVFEGPVWPSNAEKDPGPSVFPDFSRPATRAWWGGLYADLVNEGVAGIWNDMDEPAVFQTPSGTMPDTVGFDNEGQPADHREIHNVYGMLMSRSTHEGLRRLRPRERAFVLTRASFAGGQRYAAVWPGDNTSDWAHLRGSIPTLLGLGLSGFSLAGSDIGGFAGAPSAELFTRWLQLGVFYPFMRDHTELTSPDQEPWAFGTRHEAINRRAIEMRYELLPYVYDAMADASATGVPAMRPLFLDFPDDPLTHAVEDEFLFGDGLLVAPVVREGATARDVYLPAGDWYEYGATRAVAGGRSIRVPVTLDSIPVFVRAGAFLFTQPVVQSTAEMPGQPLTVTVYPAARSRGELYEDDGLTMDYLGGAFAKRTFVQQREASRCLVEVSAPEGSYRGAPRDLVLRVAWEGRPARVLVDGKALAAASGAGPGFRVEDGFVVVRMPDPWARVSLAIEG
jgi:alpha-glucosidase